MIAVFFAGLSRALVGSGTLTRSIAYPVASGLCAYVGFGLTWWAIPFAVIPALTLWLGYTKWGDPLYMMVRYGVGPTVLAIVYTAIEGNALALVWALGCILVGALYWKLLKINPRVAETVAGSVIIGGVAGV